MGRAAGVDGATERRWRGLAGRGVGVAARAGGGTAASRRREGGDGCCGEGFSSQGSAAARCLCFAEKLGLFGGRDGAKQMATFARRDRARKSCGRGCVEVGHGRSCAGGRDEPVIAKMVERYSFVRDCGRACLGAMASCSCRSGRGNSVHVVWLRHFARGIAMDVDDNLEVQTAAVVCGSSGDRRTSWAAGCGCEVLPLGITA